MRSHRPRAIGRQHSDLSPAPAPGRGALRAGEISDGVSLTPPADFIPAVTDGLLELLPGPLVALFPPASGVRLDIGPITVAVARVGGDVIAVAVGWRPTIIGSPAPGS
jgi:hypothetical protein